MIEDRPGCIVGCMLGNKFGCIVGCTAPLDAWLVTGFATNLVVNLGYNLCSDTGLILDWDTVLAAFLDTTLDVNECIGRISMLEFRKS